MAKTSNYSFNDLKINRKLAPKMDMSSEQISRLKFVANTSQTFKNGLGIFWTTSMFLIVHVDVFDRCVILDLPWTNGERQLKLAEDEVKTYFDLVI